MWLKSRKTAHPSTTPSSSKTSRISHTTQAFKSLDFLCWKTVWIGFVYNRTHSCHYFKWSSTSPASKGLTQSWRESSAKSMTWNWGSAKWRRCWKKKRKTKSTRAPNATPKWLTTSPTISRISKISSKISTGPRRQD